MIAHPHLHKVIQMTSGSGSRDALGFERINGASLARRAREAILALILRQDFEGSRLPPEGVLAEKLGVSRTTVRAALQSLEQDGFISRRRGAGTTINRNIVPGRLGLHRLVGFSTLLAEAGHTPTVEIATRVQAVDSTAWNDRLKVPPETTAYVLDKLFLADGEPAITVTDVIPVDSIREPLDGRTIPDSIFELFSTFGTQPIDHALVELAPRNASATVARRLGLRKGAAYLELVESHFAAGRPEPLALSFIDVNDSYVRFDVVRRTA
jgi:GntR family transcriptional regulator